MGVCQKMTQDDKGEGRGLEWSKKRWRNLWTAPNQDYGEEVSMWLSQFNCNFNCILALSLAKVLQHKEYDCFSSCRKICLCDIFLKQKLAIYFLHMNLIKTKGGFYWIICSDFVLDNMRSLLKFTELDFGKWSRIEYKSLLSLILHWNCRGKQCRWLLVVK